MRHYRPLLAFLLLFCIIPMTRSNAMPDQQAEFILSDRLGITHISTATDITPVSRYQQALQLGAGWNRWPLYWNWVQTDPETWDWSAFDQQVIDDINQGLNINAILIGRPEFYADNDAISGLNEPIYADGTDTPGEDKTLNSDNPWAIFVAQAVARYRPDGELAELGLLGRNQGIRVWEVWNEPDYTPFWQGGINAYARLLKVAYIVTKQVDPEAQVMFGGLLYPTENNWLAQVLRVFANDPIAAQNNYYMDIVAVHNYGDPWRSGWLTLYARQTLIAYDLDRPIWLNETGVPVWDDYPGPVWDPSSRARATQDQQAWFFIQSAAFAWSEGADKVFYHQLFDDCGDQPAGTDFPPHGGGLCSDGRLCAGDAFGIYRNLPSSVCYSQHPQPGSARPIARAYRLMAEVFGKDPFGDGDRVYEDDRFITLTFNRLLSQERITVMWNRTIESASLSWPAVGLDGQLLSVRSDSIITPDAEGRYQINLPPGLPDSDISGAPSGGVAIGGMPFILIEQPGVSVNPQLVDLRLTPPDTVDEAITNVISGGNQPIVQSASPEPEAIPTIVPTVPPARPTIDPAGDLVPPMAQVIALPPVSAPTFTVTWRGDDDSGIERYLIWVRVDGGVWQPWVETPDASAEYTGTSGSVYEFSAWAVDLAGNWSEGTDILTQAVTRVE